MRLPVDGPSGRFARLATALTLALALGAWGTTANAQRRQPLPAAPVNGPQADYPVVVGAAYTISGTEYVPEDVLNYDHVGLVAADPDGGDGVSAAHHTLPLPSYVEVTSLDTGRTALVRLERRGPMTGQELIALSPGALAQLGLVAGAPVRVRRVNPPEDQRALLRAGQAAPLRMDTPMPLVEVLRRKLPGAAHAPVQIAALPRPEQSPAAAASPPPPPLAGSAGIGSGLPALPSLDRAGASAASAPTPPATAAGQAAQTAQAAERGFVVQAAAFSTAERAERAAATLGGAVSRSGPYYRVRTGPFPTRSEAEASLAKVRAAGYRDARIFTSG